MTSIKDVAKKAGVSVATVSRVLNDSHVVKEETAKIVRQAIEELSYSPNLLGRNLRVGNTKKILVLLNTISNQFYSRVVRGIEEATALQKYGVMIAMTHNDKEIEKQYLTLIKAKLVDGAIFLTTENDGDFLEHELCGLPTVQACEPRAGFNTPTVTIDNQEAGYTATRYLIDKGFKDIAFFGAESVYESSYHRKIGYQKALEEANREIRGELIFDEGYGVTAGANAARRLLENNKNSLPDAVFCISDSLAAGAIKTFIKSGLRVPEDISVMGFDNTKLSETFVPEITTTRQPQYDIGYTAGKLLLKLIRGKKIEEPHVVLPYEIIERDSVK